MKLKCIIADDEPLAQKGLAEYISDVDFLELIAMCSNAAQAYDFINKTDLIFLDIEMPGMSGIDFVKSLSNAPAVIFTTAYPQYALHGYELNITDYLVKPIAFERFVKAVNKAKEFIAAYNRNTQNEINDDYFFIKANYKMEKIFFREILFIEALQNYIAIHFGDKKLISYHTISGIEKQLPASQFMRIHKSYIASLSNIDGVTGSKIIIQGKELPVSRSVKEKLLKVLESKMIKR